MTEKIISEISNGIKSNMAPDNVFKKSKLWSYILWLTGGLFGAHHFYLNRDLQAWIWLTSFGGYFGCGWLVDLFKISTYVAEANNEQKYNEWFKHQIRSYGKPQFSVIRFLGSFFISSLWAHIVYLGIPEEEIYGINLKYFYIFIPLVIALGTWIIGNVGRERGSIWICLMVSYMCYPTLYYLGDITLWIYLMSLSSTLAFDTFSKQWRLNPRKKTPMSHRIFITILIFAIYISLISSYFYFNVAISDSKGEKIKISEAVKHFFSSPIWLDLKTSLEHTWSITKHKGFWAIWKELIDLSDLRGEINAYKVLGLSQTASPSEVTWRWRKLSREHHPDKVKGSETERRAAQEKFMKIQKAYEILSRSKNRRQKRNLKYSKD